jgi:hypothetical protein
MKSIKVWAAKVRLLSPAFTTEGKLVAGSGLRVGLIRSSVTPLWPGSLAGSCQMMISKSISYRLEILLIC